MCNLLSALASTAICKGFEMFTITSLLISWLMTAYYSSGEIENDIIENCMIVLGRELIGANV
jgi:hypothetical protein